MAPIVRLLRALKCRKFIRTKTVNGVMSRLINLLNHRMEHQTLVSMVLEPQQKLVYLKAKQEEFKTLQIGQDKI